MHAGGKNQKRSHFGETYNLYSEQILGRLKFSEWQESGKSQKQLFRPQEASCSCYLSQAGGRKDSLEGSDATQQLTEVRLIELQPR